MPKRWIFRTPPDTPAQAAEAERLQISPFILELLRLRGLAGTREMDVFLSPLLRHLAHHSAVPGMNEAARLLADGLNAGGTLAVWGDYDVDGVTSTALVLDFLRQRSIKALSHIPERMSEGYGMNPEGVERLAQAGADMILTVDCGISDVDSIARAKELGLTVVVTDHHLPGETLPPADAACNPRLGQCLLPEGMDGPTPMLPEREHDPYGFQHLAGVGVVFLLMAAVNRLLDEKRFGPPLDMKDFLDLVALGTLADVVPLTGQNRILTKNGLLLLADGTRPGLAALKEAAGYAVDAALGAGQVSFQLAPRINAAGRMGHAGDALDLLLMRDFMEARKPARLLNDLNTKRRAEEERILGEAMAQAEGLGDRLGLVVAAENWHPGVIGIVASRLTEAFYKPALVLNLDQDVLTGSGRSISEVNLHDALKACAPLLNRFGGHKQAAGLSLDAARLDELRDAFDRAIAGQIGESPLLPKLNLDTELPFSLIDFTLLKELEMLQPFGPGNPEPVFASPPVRVQEHRLFGRKREHLLLTLRDEEACVTLKAKGWRMGGDFPASMEGRMLTIAFSPKIDRFDGTPRIELNIKDWQTA